MKQSTESTEEVLNTILRNREYVYEKCANCHLFVEENSAFDGGEIIAPFIHLARGDDDDEAIENDHDATPSGQKRTRAWWRKNGPLPLRARFEVALYEGFLELQKNGIYDAYPVTALVEFAYEYPDEGLNAIGNRTGDFHEWLQYWERVNHGKLIMSARLDRMMPNL